MSVYTGPVQCDRLSGRMADTRKHVSLFWNLKAEWKGFPVLGFFEDEAQNQWKFGHGLQDYVIIANSEEPWLLLQGASTRMPLRNLFKTARSITIAEPLYNFTAAATTTTHDREGAFWFRFAEGASEAGGCGEGVWDCFTATEIASPASP